MTDAGTPGVSDPGEALVAAAIAAGVAVVPIPGASAVLAALVASGLAGDGRFRFVGFLPRDGAARREAIALVVRDAGGGRALRGAEPRAGARCASSPTRRPSAARASRAS